MLVTENIRIPDNELQFTFVRSSGAGGQNVNKVNSKAVLRWPVTANRSLPKDVRHRFVLKYQQRINKIGDLLLVSQKYRDQTRNVDDCLKKLSHMLLTVAKAPIKRKATKPTAASKKRRVEVKRVTSVKKQLRRRPSADE
jgi:ribosome-associated protein